MEFKNIQQKMLEATKRIEAVEKDLIVQATKTQSYKAVSESTIINAVKPIEIELGIYSYPVSRKIVDTAILEKESTFNKETTIKKSLYMRIETIYRFVNIDNPSDYIEVTSYGDGIDSGDKATGKAMTYADKYALMKAYKISTGDDPDQEASQEYDNAKATPKQIEMLAKYYTGENLAKLLQANNITKLEDISKQTASKLIGKIMEKNNENH